MVELIECFYDFCFSVMNYCLANSSAERPIPYQPCGPLGTRPPNEPSTTAWANNRRRNQRTNSCVRQPADWDHKLSDVSRPTYSVQHRRKWRHEWHHIDN